METEIEAVHLAIALAYYGLLRAPSRAESSDITPCECRFTYEIQILIGLS
jgi:hypothetical protein